MRASLDSGAPTPHPPPWTSGCTCCTSLSSNGRRGRSGSGLGMLMQSLWPSAGAGVRVGIRRGWRPCRFQFQEQHPGLRSARAGFQSAGVQGGTEQVAWWAWSGAATSVFTARASPRRPAAARVAAPPAFAVCPWEKGGCVGEAVARRGQGGNALCLCWMEIKLPLNVIRERFKNTEAHETHFRTLVRTTFFFFLPPLGKDL